MMVELTIEEASNGDHIAALILAVFIESQKELKLEPLIVGLKILLGEERPLVPQEIFEIGKDIADRIRSKQATLAKPTPTDSPIQ